ncbi:MAG TPA: hypothetical protein VFC63_00300 [Blastocatellia bacterium]|nr:hypothetical protein [Blastocatellia bacterium]
MKKLLVSSILILISALVSLAQDAPKYEISAGFSNLHESPPFFQKQNYSGWYATVARNFTDWFGVEAEVSGYYARFKEPVFVVPLTPPSTTSVRIKSSDHLFLGGPRFSYRGINHLTLFAHGLVGARYNENSEKLEPSAASAFPIFTAKFVHTSLAVGTGGGVDIGITQSLAFRAIQADYIHSGTSFEQDRNDLRLSTGIVFRFGGK